MERECTWEEDRVWTEPQSPGSYNTRPLGCEFKLVASPEGGEVCVVSLLCNPT